MVHQVQSWLVHSEAETDEVGRQLAATLRPGDTVALIGTLGAGKTRLTQAIAAAMGVDRETVISPTFTLCNEYQGTQQQLYHLDLYRIRDVDELLELGFEEYCNSDRITLVEWADRFLEELPQDRVEIEIEVVDREQRRIVVRRLGAE